MFFTQEDYNRILSYIISKSKADSAFSTISSVDGSELIPLVKSGINKNITISNLASYFVANSKIKQTTGSSTTDIMSQNAVTTELSSKYVKPSSGIPSTDLASAVQTSLGKADTALQPNALTPYRTAADQTTIDNSKASKVSGTVTGKLPKLSSSGDLVDSGIIADRVCGVFNSDGGLLIDEIENHDDFVEVFSNDTVAKILKGQITTIVEGSIDDEDADLTVYKVVGAYSVQNSNHLVQLVLSTPTSTGLIFYRFTVYYDEPEDFLVNTYTISIT